MAITKLTEGKYAGISTDIKPAGAKYGASFYEYDTESLWDKAYVGDPTINNGWIKRVSLDASGAADSIGGKIVAIAKDGQTFIVVKTGNNPLIFQAGDLVLGLLSETELIIGRVKPGPNGFTTKADLDRLTGGEIFVP